ncbi:MAG: 30S ribosome-binding factor RbfA [Acidimicrobiia bacterium]|nr:30S ribosome-binding factor RbfA [Acidimicrobiia bacterium]MDH4365862.1 30S ribosome-binding factor RbfA [Acidimicrobiia bacterium]
MAQRSDKRRPRPATKRQYPRTARLNTLLQQIVAEYLERIDDEQLELLTVTGVEVDADLNKAVVWISTLADESRDSEILDLLGGRYRKPLQAEIARSARLRKTPEVTFAFDPAIRTGARIETILSSLHIEGDDDGAADGAGATSDGGAGPAGEGAVP